MVMLCTIQPGGRGRAKMPSSGSTASLGFVLLQDAMSRFIIAHMHMIRNPKVSEIYLMLPFAMPISWDFDLVPALQT